MQINSYPTYRDVQLSQVQVACEVRDERNTETEFNQQVRSERMETLTENSNTINEKHIAEMLASFRGDIFNNTLITKALLN